MTKALRAGKVLIDWSQNDSHKTTVCVYSLRARDRPTVSTPLEWDELRAALDAGDPDALRFDAATVLERVRDARRPVRAGALACAEAAVALRRAARAVRVLELALVGPTPGQADGAAARRERERVGDAHAGAEPVRQPGGERVAAAVGIDRLARDRCRGPATGEPVARAVGAAARAFGEDKQLGLVFDRRRSVALDRVARAEHERVDRNAVPERVARPGVRDEHARRARGAQRVDVAGREVHGVDLRELVPRQRTVVAERLQALAERRDRPLARVVDERDGPACRLLARRVRDAHAELAQPHERAARRLVVAERRDQQRLPGEPRELHRDDRAAAGRLLERVARVHDLAGARHVRHVRVLDPLDVAHDRDARSARLHARQSRTRAPRSVRLDGDPERRGQRMRRGDEVARRHRQPAQRLDADDRLERAAANRAFAQTRAAEVGAGQVAVLEADRRQLGLEEARLA